MDDLLVKMKRTSRKHFEHEIKNISSIKKYFEHENGGNVEKKIFRAWIVLNLDFIRKQFEHDPLKKISSMNVSLLWF